MIEERQCLDQSIFTCEILINQDISYLIEDKYQLLKDIYLLLGDK